MFCITSARPPLQHIIKALSASTELGINAQPEDLPELHSPDLMEDAIIMYVLLSKAGIGTFERWQCGLTLIVAASKCCVNMVCTSFVDWDVTSTLHDRLQLTGNPSLGGHG